jgi:hypothetical protein
MKYGDGKQSENKNQQCDKNNKANKASYYQ